MSKHIGLTKFLRPGWRPLRTTAPPPPLIHKYEYEYNKVIYIPMVILEVVADDYLTRDDLFHLFMAHRDLYLQLCLYMYQKHEKDVLSMLVLNWAAREGQVGFFTEVLDAWTKARRKPVYTRAKSGLTPLLAAVRGPIYTTTAVRVTAATSTTIAGDEMTGRHKHALSTLPGREAIVRLLLQRGDTDLLATLAGDVIVRHDASVPARTFARTVLHVASEGLAPLPPSVLDTLLSFISPEALEAGSSTGWTPLLWAVRFRNTDVASWLLARGAHGHARSIPSASTALHIACSTPSINADHHPGHGYSGGLYLPELHDLLVCRGAVDIHAPDAQGRTALHCAAEISVGGGDGGGRNAISWLIAQGANVEATDNFGRTPLDVAAHYGLLGNVEVLLKAVTGVLVPEELECESEAEWGYSDGEEGEEEEEREERKRERERETVGFTTEDVINAMADAGKIKVLCIREKVARDAENDGSGKRQRMV